MFIFFIVAGMILSLGSYLLISRIRFIKNGVIAEATIEGVHIVKSDDPETADTIYPILKLYNINNEELIFQAEELTVDAFWQRGDKITIVYVQHKPQHAISLTYGGSFGIIIILFSLALALIIFSAGYYWAQHFFETLPVQFLIGKPQI
jgi:hypothetical protein